MIIIVFYIRSLPTLISCDGVSVRFRAWVLFYLLMGRGGRWGLTYQVIVGNTARGGGAVSFSPLPLPLSFFF